jgi:hypothetical protein
MRMNDLLTGEQTWFIQKDTQKDSSYPTESVGGLVDSRKKRIWNAE